jgi:signal transduction histidine kinase
MWELETLGDFAEVTRWFQQALPDDPVEALTTCYRHMTARLRIHVDEYQHLAETLDKYSGGLLSAPGSLAKPGRDAQAGQSLLSNLQDLAAELREYLDPLLLVGDHDLYGFWQVVFGSEREYLLLLHTLINQFGNFEGLLPTLPGTGPIITGNEIQDCIDRMYHINTSNMRMLDLARQATRRAAGADISPRSFFSTEIDLNRIVENLFAEYLTRADPEDIRRRKLRALQSGTRYKPYRFWRAAETLRLMADVSYDNDLARTPSMTRRFLETDLHTQSTFTGDWRRIEWALIEIINNSISAASQLSITPQGEWSAKPPPKHNLPEPPVAIRIDLTSRTRRHWLRKRTHLRLIIADRGVGIGKQHLPYVTLWGYSPRRDYFRQLARQSRSNFAKAHREIQIGGKGIGLSYARAVIVEHGGTMRIESEADLGTTVTIDLPLPTPFDFEP